MIPLRDTVRSRTFPIVNWALIVANVAVFLFETSLGPNGIDRLFRTFALIPSHVSSLSPTAFITLVTSMFLHGGWLHIISNMWVLYIFGDNIEDRMGSTRYLAFYLLAGIAAGLTQVFVNPNANVPTVGASGAVAGILGAYFLLFPTGRVITLVPLIIIPWLVEIPAVIFIGIWLVTQVISGLGALVSAGAVSNIAWWAHIGGFAFGFVMVNIFKRRPRAYAEWHRDEYWPY